MRSKKILFIYPPRDIAVRSIHEKIYSGLKELNYDIDFLSFENVPKFKNDNFYDRLLNIYYRVVKKDNSYIFKAEKNFYNKYFTNELSKFIAEDKKKYDYTLIIKPEEFDLKFIKKLKLNGGKLFGFMWDALRLHLKNDLLKCRSHYSKLYSFDKNNIKDYPDLNLKFLTNFNFPDSHIIPYENRKLDFFYIGAIAGTLPEQRRDWKLHNLSKVLDGCKEINIHTPPDFLVKDKQLIKDNTINYITNATTINETLLKVKNSRVLIDVCKKQHIGLSFRFFESMLYQTKIITNNKDIVNYDFYNSSNILIVDFDNINVNKEQVSKFLEEPYQPISEELLIKYSLDNWIKFVLSIGDFIPIENE